VQNHHDDQSYATDQVIPAEVLNLNFCIFDIEVLHRSSEISNLSGVHSNIKLMVKKTIQRW
jgi:hypothetical protein